MKTVFDKLNLKDATRILVINAPASFDAELLTLTGIEVVRDVGAGEQLEFALAFVTRQKEVDSIASVVAANCPGDVAFWFAYAKGSSKKYKPEINRDHGWGALGNLGFEAVRQIAIDEDWSALRFRRVEYIKSLKRDRKMAMSIAGRRRTAGRSD